MCDAVHGATSIHLLGSMDILGAFLWTIESFIFHSSMNIEAAFCTAMLPV